MNRYIVIKYVKLLHLTRMIERRNEIIFKCPIPNCDDLKSKKFYGRGYILGFDSDKPIYYCHNCGTSMSFIYFVKMIDEKIYRSLLSELKDYKFNSIIHTSNTRKIGKEIKENKKIKIEEKSIKIEDELYPISRFRNNTLPVKYLSKRNIPKKQWKRIFYFNGNPYAFFKRLFKSNKYDDRNKKSIIEGLLYPFYDKNHILYGFAIRNLDSKSSQRFINLRIDDIPIDFLGIDRVDFNKKIYIVEGIYDKLSFVRDRQILAMLSLNIKTNNIPNGINTRNIVYCFDNEYNNEFLVRNAQSIIRRGFGLMLWDKRCNVKDVNDLKQKGLNDDEILKYFDNNTYHGMVAELELNSRVVIHNNKKQYS